MERFGDAKKAEAIMDSFENEGGHDNQSRRED